MRAPQQGGSHSVSGVRIYFCTISDLFSNTLTAPCPQPALPVLRNVPWGGIRHLQVSASTKKEKGSAQKGRKEHSEEPRPSGSQDFPVSMLEWDKQPLQKGKADRIAAIVLFLWELLLQPASKCTSRRNSHTCQQGCD